MRTLLIVVVCLISTTISFSQNRKVPPQKYPSLLWEISGNGLSKPSYLFGTMHVSSKMVFHLSDSFYLGIRNADIVALETNPGEWQDDFSRYDLDGQANPGSWMSRWKDDSDSPQDYLTISSLQFMPYTKMIEVALYSNPAIVNNFLYRSGSEASSDFEEDTYLDLHIFQVGKKWGKKLCGVENFDQSMQLMKEAYSDASREKRSKERSMEYDDDFSYGKLEDAYRTGNLDLLDTINKINSTSAAFDEKFLYRRNEIQAASIDSILRTKASLFVGVGAAHLPGQRGVIEWLRKKGYQLRPIKMTERDSRHKEEIEKIRVSVPFNVQSSADGFFRVRMPGKLYSFNRSFGLINQQQYADMVNGSYYMVTRINTNAAMWGHSPDMIEREVDSVVYENIPGKILSKKMITRNGYRGMDIVNRTRRGDYQRYNIFITPFEVIIFKMSGNGDYVREGTEADQFFNSIELKNYKSEWKKYSPSFGSFEVEMPHEPVVVNAGNWQFMAADAATGTSFSVIRTDVHNYDFAEEDSFDLGLMDESFGSSDFIDKEISRRLMVYQGYPALDVRYRYKDGSIANVRFLIQGAHYYTLMAHSRKENPKMGQFLNSFRIMPLVYQPSLLQKDTTLLFSVHTPVSLMKQKKLELYPSDLYRGEDNEGLALEENGTFKSKLVTNDSTGEKIYISYFRPSRYYFNEDSVSSSDTTHFKTDKQDWTYRSRKKYYLPDSTKVFEYIVGDPRSSRTVHGKIFSKEGVHYRLESEGDTLTKESPFISGFFESFAPADTIRGINPKVRKSKLFFADFFSTDTLLHKKAVRNVSKVKFDSLDLDQIKECIRTISWKEKRYIDVKKDFIDAFSDIKTRNASLFLKDLYYAAADTVEFQYAALDALLHQKTLVSYEVFRDIMVNDPPVLDIERSAQEYRPSLGKMIYSAKVAHRSYRIYTGDIDRSEGGSFLDNLTDSLQLTSAIIKDLLPLINIHDYEQPLIEVMKTLVDSNQIQPSVYELYLPKFLIEAKQQAKKQIITEKNRLISKVKNDSEENGTGNDRDDKDYGNNQLIQYATLLLPFWDKNPAIPTLVQQLLGSNDNRLKYNTTMLMLRYKKPVPDTLLNYLAAKDEYRYELYNDLKEMKRLSYYPAAYNNKILLAKGKLYTESAFALPDSVVYIDKLPLSIKDKKGSVYFFKYKQRKDDDVWKLASVGLLPDDPKYFEFDLNDEEEDLYHFTDFSGSKISQEEPMKEQLQNALKRLSYSKRNSGAQFYNDQNKTSIDFLKNISLKN